MPGPELPNVKLRRDDERALVEPDVDGRLRQLTGTDPVRPLTADADVGDVARDGRRKRQAAPVVDDPLQLPAADDRVWQLSGSDRNRRPLPNGRS